MSEFKKGNLPEDGVKKMVGTGSMALISPV
jgi:hypothetical protein